jgi:predicted Zn-dependent protease
MLGEARAIETLKRIISMVEAEQAEAIMLGGTSALTRFANSTIHQNVFEKDNVIFLRVAKGKKIGVASSNIIDDEALKNLAARAAEIAESQVPNPDFESFVRSPAAEKVEAFHEETETCSAERRARNVEALIGEADKLNFLAAGSHSTTAREMAFTNSLGTEQYHRYTSVFMNTVVMSPTSSGYADCSCLDIADLDPKRLGEEATKVCADSQEPRELPEGRYDVVLSPYALDELMTWLNYIGFGADPYQEGRSFMSGKLGEAIMGSNVSMWDDGLDTRGLPLPFDFQGVPRQRVDLIKNGVAEGIVYDSLTAHKDGKQSTGHALPPGEEISSMPLNTFVATGGASQEEMIESLDRGLFVRRFHYVNGFLEPRRALFTGMTRDGTFFVENGKIKYPVKNLRFTHSMLDAFSNVEMISKEAKLQVSSWMGASMVPALKIKGFNFSGKTEF